MNMNEQWGVLPRVMKRENQGLYNGGEKERRKQRIVWRRERENGEKRNVGPITVIKLGPT